MPKQPYFNLDREKQEEIRKVCLEEFVEHGFRNASTNRIVSRLSIAKGSLFYYFDGKADIYRYLVEDAHRRFGDGMKRLLRDWPSDILERIREMTRTGIALFRKMPLEYRLLMGILDEETEALRDGFLQKLGESSLSMFQDLFSGVDTANFRYGRDETVQLAGWVYTGIKLELSQLMEVRDDIDALERHFMARLEDAFIILARGIYTGDQEVDRNDKGE